MRPCVNRHKYLNREAYSKCAVYMSKDATENATFGVRPNLEYISKCDAVYMTHIKYRISSYSEQ